jgi:hypothetical protein
MVVALIATIASVAQAGPEFYSKSAIGVPTAPQKFTVSGAGVVLEVGSRGFKIDCHKTTGSGEVDTATTVRDVKILLQQCEGPPLGDPCGSEGRGVESREIELEPLSGELGAISATTPGVRLAPESAAFIAQINCEPFMVPITLKGSVIGSDTGSGTTVDNSKFVPTLKIVYAESKGIQKYTHFLTGPSEQLTSVVKEGGNPPTEELTGQSGTFTLTDVENPTDDNLGVTK